ncbi:acyl carrier protein [[Clostridium] polysaccharolyticum]|uniref:Phosphopantetheine attachment site n=1 Tax=[Clostridium] polysaccharolyticum TaxID=29364 RepID=A0A1I0E5P7_9FIRM|nr:acyl carrier protein [[Clostridium] polysaccharolyticum]SET39955.1 Phosphopantetheine attachment site [[Clostridium] polysaccharolyticum]
MREKIKAFIEENVILEDVEIKDSDNIFELGIVSSLFSMKLITFLENEFQATIEYEDMKLENFNSIDNIISYLQSKES